MARGLYEMVREHHTAAPKRMREIEYERAARFPDVHGWPQNPDMFYCELATDVWGWDYPRADTPYLDDDGQIVTGFDE